MLNKKFFSSGYVKNNQANKAIDLFNQIKNPDELNITVLFNACAQLGTDEALNLVKKVSKEIPKSFYSNPRLVTSLLDALMKCGDVQHAQSLFDASTKKDLPMYGAMMNGNNYLYIELGLIRIYFLQVILKIIKQIKQLIFTIKLKILMKLLPVSCLKLVLN